LTVILALAAVVSRLFRRQSTGVHHGVREFAVAASVFMLLSVGFVSELTFAAVPDGAGTRVESRDKLAGASVRQSPSGPDDPQFAGILSGQVIGPEGTAIRALPGCTSRRCVMGSMARWRSGPSRALTGASNSAPPT